MADQADDSTQPKDDFQKQADHEQRKEYLKRVLQELSTAFSAAVTGDFVRPIGLECIIIPASLQDLRDQLQRLRLDFVRAIHSVDRLPKPSIRSGCHPVSHLEKLSADLVGHVKDVRSKISHADATTGFSISTVCHLFFDQAEPWAAVAIKYLERNWAEVATFLSLILARLVGETAGNRIIAEIIEPLLNEILEECRQRLNDALAPSTHGFPILYDPDLVSYIGTRRHEFTRLDMAERVQRYMAACNTQPGRIGNQLLVNPSAQVHGPIAHDHLMQYLIPSTAAEADVTACSEMVFCMQGVYQRALQDFQKIVPAQCIEIGLLAVLDEVLSSDLVTQVDDSVIDSITAETTESRLDRFGLTTERVALLPATASNESTNCRNASPSSYRLLKIRSSTSQALAKRLASSSDNGSSIERKRTRHNDPLWAQDPFTSSQGLTQPMESNMPLLNTGTKGSSPATLIFGTGTSTPATLVPEPAKASYAQNVRAKSTTAPVPQPTVSNEPAISFGRTGFASFPLAPHASGPNAQIYPEIAKGTTAASNGIPDALAPRMCPEDLANKSLGASAVPGSTISPSSSIPAQTIAGSSLGRITMDLAVPSEARPIFRSTGHGRVAGENPFSGPLDATPSTSISSTSSPTTSVPQPPLPSATLRPFGGSGLFKGFATETTPKPRALVFPSFHFHNLCPVITGGLFNIKSVNGCPGTSPTFTPLQSINGGLTCESCQSYTAGDPPFGFSVEEYRFADYVMGRRYKDAVNKPYEESKRRSEPTTAVALST